MHTMEIFGKILGQITSTSSSQDIEILISGQTGIIGVRGGSLHIGAPLRPVIATPWTKT